MRVWRTDQYGNPIIYSDGRGFYLNTPQGLVPCDRNGNPINQPMSNPQQPMGGYQPPMGGYQQPMGGYQQPMGGYQQPMVNTPPVNRGYQQPMVNTPPVNRSYQPPAGGYAPNNVNPFPAGNRVVRTATTTSTGGKYKPMYGGRVSEVDDVDVNGVDTAANEFSLNNGECPDLSGLESVGVPLPPLFDEEKEDVIIRVEGNKYSFIKVNRK